MRRTPLNHHHPAHCLSGCHSSTRSRALPHSGSHAPRQSTPRPLDLYSARASFSAHVLAVVASTELSEQQKLQQLEACVQQVMGLMEGDQELSPHAPYLMITRLVLPGCYGISGKLGRIWIWIVEMALLSWCFVLFLFALFSGCWFPPPFLLCCLPECYLGIPEGVGPI